VPLPLRPLQQPHPAFWYGSSNAIGSTFAGEEGMHFVSLGPTDFAKKNIDAFRVALTKRGGAALPKAEFRGGAAIGVLRNIVVADTDAEARRIAGPAIAHHVSLLNWLRDHHGATDLTARLNVPRPATLDHALADGSVIAGAPDTVVAAIERQTAELGINYLLAYLFFGKMTLPEALRSLELMRTEVMPRIAHL
jgi:alkanesulfonate monooxygenase SsuD/methylene tetrahydromethanopterin reductase-like flavin-dependent oxidoreductase (luciferase family)